MISDTIDRISVLITAYKNAELVKRFVDSLRAAFGGALPETVIVDDAAGDAATAELAASYAAEGVRFAVMPQNGGFAGANNFGWPLCMSPNVLPAPFPFPPEPGEEQLALKVVHKLHSRRDEERNKAA